MSTQPQDVNPLQAFTNAIREHWKIFFAEGVVLLLLGLLAVALPMLATIGFAIVLGWLFLFSGLIGLGTTFYMRGAPGFWWALISALIGIGAGVVLLISPASGAVVHAAGVFNCGGRIIRWLVVTQARIGRVFRF